MVPSCGHGQPHRWSPERVLLLRLSYVPTLQVDTASRKVVVANAGDSRCVVSRRGQAVDMSHDHKPTDPREESRINRVSR